MAGHSKWANIKYRKGREDARRGKVFTKLIREITVAARINSDIHANARLRLAVDKAYSENMAKETIERAIKRGAFGLKADNLEEVRYEGYGPAGVAILVECMTNNRNRTVGEVRYTFSKSGGNLGTEGSVAYLFNKKGVISVAASADENLLMEVALTAGAEDIVKRYDGSLEVLVPLAQLEGVQHALLTHNLKPCQIEVTWLPASYVELDQEEAEKVKKLLEALEDLEDVQNVYANAHFVEDVA